MNITYAPATTGREHQVPGTDPAGPTLSAGPRSAPRRVLRALAQMVNVFFSLVLAVAFALFALLAVGPHVAGYRTATMLSGSMRPHIRPGDVVVDTPEPLTDVAVGQVITFHTPTPTGYVDSHRVIEVRHRGNLVLIRTKGDANAVADPWLAQLQGTTAWRVRMVIPRLGSAIHGARTVAAHGLFEWSCLGLLVTLVLAAIWSPDSPRDRARTPAPGGDASPAGPTSGD